MTRRLTLSTFAALVLTFLGTAAFGSTISQHQPALKTIAYVVARR